MEPPPPPSADPTATLIVLLVVAGVSLYYFFLRSAETENRGGNTAERLSAAQKNSKLDIEAIAAECKASGKLWKDPTFGHDGYPGPSIGMTMELRDGERGQLLKLGSGGVTWQPPHQFTGVSRPLGVRGDGVPTWLYSDNDGDGVVSAAEGMTISDAAQGSVGNCYFLCALAAAVQHHPDLADDLIDETYEEQGIYGVSFWRRGSWQMTWVDSYFPCYRPSSRRSGGKYRPLFAGSADRKEIWPLVVEKAFAKVAGSYEAIAGGHISDSLEMLTGGKSRRRSCSSSNDGSEWERFKQEVLSDEFLVGAGSQQLCMDTSEATEQKKILQGIITGHAYSIVNVYEKDGLRLVELRNPWGRGQWTGDWGANSYKWKSEEGRQVIAKVGTPRSSGGRFWMSWEDFTTCFSSIDTCHMNFSAEDRARREALAAEAARVFSERPTNHETSNSSGEQPAAYTQESADAMMELLIAEEAAEKRKAQIGARGNKKRTKN